MANVLAAEGDSPTRRRLGRSDRRAFQPPLSRLSSLNIPQEDRMLATRGCATVRYFPGDFAQSSADTLIAFNRDHYGPLIEVL